MPELPEVETIVNGLQKQIIGKKIVRARVVLPKIIRGNVGDFITLISFFAFFALFVVIS